MTDDRYSLRRLPLAARLVIALFLLAVGLGYCSALIQLHLQHSRRDGSALPGPSDVVEVFAGVKRYDPRTADEPISKLEKLIMGPIEGASWNGSGSMAAAFFHKDGADYRQQARDLKDDPQGLAKLNAEREGERISLRQWVRLPDDQRKNAYDADRLDKPAEIVVTSDYLQGDVVKIRTLFVDRCVRCHGKDGEQHAYPLETYEQISKYLDVPVVQRPEPGSWVPSDRQMSIEKLTQSTHAHLLSFAMLFGLTGLCFAFTSYPASVRLMLAPLVLLAQILDIACWWLARVPDVGPYFAYAILGTGGLVGLGLGVQIVGCLFDMFGRAGRIVLLVLFLLGAAGFAVLYTKTIEPALTAQKQGRT